MKNEKIRLSGYVHHSSLVNGEGCRMVVFTQGCKHNCKGCFNPETHSLIGGREYDIEYLYEEFKKDEPFIDGVTLSGGDPVLQAAKLIDFCKYVRSRGKTVWCYTGFTFDYLLQKSHTVANSHIKEFLENIDVLVDGKFVESLKEEGLKYRGSTNQRLVDVQMSLEKKSVVLKTNI